MVVVDEAGDVVVVAMTDDVVDVAESFDEFEQPLTTTRSEKKPINATAERENLLACMVHNPARLSTSG